MLKELNKEELSIINTVEISLDSLLPKNPEKLDKFYISELKILKDYLIDLNKSDFIKSQYDSMSIHEIHDLNVLESALSPLVITNYNYLLDKLAQIWYRLIKNHPFTNGNKRTAMFGVKYYFIELMTSLIFSNFHFLLNKQLNNNLDENFKRKLKLLKKQNIKVSANQLRKFHKTLFIKFNKKWEKEYTSITSYLFKYMADIYNDEKTILEDQKITLEIAKNHESEISHDKRKIYIDNLKLNLANFYVRSYLKSKEIKFLFQENEKIIFKWMKEEINDKKLINFLNSKTFKVNTNTKTMKVTSKMKK